MVSRLGRGGVSSNVVRAAGSKVLTGCLTAMHTQSETARGVQGSVSGPMMGDPWVALRTLIVPCRPPSGGRPTPRSSGPVQRYCGQHTHVQGGTQELQIVGSWRGGGGRRDRCMMDCERYVQQIIETLPLCPALRFDSDLWKSEVGLVASVSDMIGRGPGQSSTAFVGQAVAVSPRTDFADVFVEQQCGGHEGSIPGPSSTARFADHINFTQDRVNQRFVEQINEPLL